MKEKLIYSVLSLLFSFTLIYPTKGQEKKPEPTNTGTAKHGTIVKGWGLGTPSNCHEPGLDTNVRYEGTTSFYIKSTSVCSSEEKRGAGLTQHIMADNYRGKRVRLSGYLKTNNANQGGLIWVRVYDDQGGLLAVANMQSGRVKGTVDWKKSEVVLNVHEKAAHVAFGIHFIGNGQLWVDDLNLEVTAPDVNITDRDAQLRAEIKGEEDLATTNKTEYDRIIQQRKALISMKRPAAPVNLNFETL